MKLSRRYQRQFLLFLLSFFFTGQERNYFFIENRWFNFAAPPFCLIIIFPKFHTLSKAFRIFHFG